MGHPVQVNLMAETTDLPSFWRKASTARERARLGKTPPEWIKRFGAAYADPSPTLFGPRGLLNAVPPLADGACRSVRNALGTFSRIAGTEAEREALAQSMEKSLIDTLFRYAAPCLVLELGVAGKRKLLAGSNPEERYEYFCANLFDKAFARDLLLQYPTLVRRLVDMIGQWERANLELLQRLSRDIDKIEREILEHDAGALVNVEALGDTHREGRTVSRLTFASGQRLIYKPRPVHMEHGYYELIAWLNDAGLRPDLKAARAINCNDYGWVRHLDTTPCADLEAVARFYRRQGGNLALSYVLGATDLHYENVLAAGEYPVIVDLETLFHPDPRAPTVNSASFDAQRMIDGSVLRTLMLPTTADTWPQDGKPAADFSALGYIEGADAPSSYHEWDNWGTDRIRMVERRGTMPTAHCFPEVDGKRIAATNHVDEIANGFASVYDFCHQRRSSLAGRHGPMQGLRYGLVRHVFRNTAYYIRVLAESWHPRLCINMTTLERHLQRRLDTAARMPASIRNAEIVDLLRGDVPYFQFPLSARSSRTDHAAKLRGVTQLSRRWPAFTRRLNSLTSIDRDRQIWIARTSFAKPDALHPPRVAPAAMVVNRAAIREHAIRIGDHLCDLAVVRDGRASWLFPMITADNRYTPATVGFDLHDGLAGIALFLARLSLESKSRKHRAMAAAAIAEALVLHRQVRKTAATGAYDGVAGLAYATALAGRWLKRDDWSRKAVALLRMHEKRAQVSQPDLMSGASGFLVAAIAIAEAAGIPSLKRDLAPIASALFAIPHPSLPAKQDAGMAHGRAGIGFALLRWARWTADQTMFAKAKSLMAFDIRIAAEARRADDESTERSGTLAGLAWCRGGLGVSLAALRVGADVVSEATILVRDIAKQSDTTISQAGICSCHGLIGTLEFLDAATKAGIVGAAAVHERLFRQTLARIAHGEWCSDQIELPESPGMMLGLAGTGYALLRAIDDSVPSLLTLDSP